MKTHLLGAVCACFFTLFTLSSENATVYHVNRSVDTFDPRLEDVAVTGFIETVGTIGLLSESNILSLRLNFEVPQEADFILTSATDVLRILADVTALSATPTQIVFDFNSVDGIAAVIFAQSGTSRDWCLVGAIKERCGSETSVEVVTGSNLIPVADNFHSGLVAVAGGSVARNNVAFRLRPSWINEQTS